MPRMFSSDYRNRDKLSCDKTRDVSWRYHPKPDAKPGPSPVTHSQRLRALANTNSAEHSIHKAQATSLSYRRKTIPITLATVSLENKP